MKPFVYMCALSATLATQAAYGTDADTGSRDFRPHKPRDLVFRLSCEEEARWSAERKRKLRRFHRHNYNGYLDTTDEAERLEALCEEMGKIDEKE